MSRIIARKESEDACRMWAVLELDSSERVMLSITVTEIALVRLYLGCIPSPIAKWNPMIGVLMLSEKQWKPSEDPMDAMIEKLTTFKRVRDLQAYLRQREPVALKRLNELQEEMTGM